MKKLILQTTVAVLFYSQLGLAAQYSAVKDFLTKLAQDNPTTTTLFTLGKSNDGQDIVGVKIGSGTVKHLVVATHHGNEYGSTEVAKGFAASLAKDPIIDRVVFVIPVLNTSGYNKGQRNELSSDPNRDYPGPCGTAGPHKLKSTKALAEFIDKEEIVASATLHTYYPGVLYPWGIPTHDLKTPYEQEFVSLANYAAQFSGYTVGNSTVELYPVEGAFEDYAYWKHGIWSLLFEMGNTHSPNQAQIAELLRVNVPGLRKMMEMAPTVRAEKHQFTGKCDARLRSLDRHDE